MFKFVKSKSMSALNFVKQLGTAKVKYLSETVREKVLEPVKIEKLFHILSLDVKTSFLCFF